MTDRNRAKERALWADILMAYDSSRGENYVNRYSENPVWGNTDGGRIYPNYEKINHIFLIFASC